MASVRHRLVAGLAEALSAHICIQYSPIFDSEVGQELDLQTAGYRADTVLLRLEGVADDQRLAGFEGFRGRHRATDHLGEIAGDHGARIIIAVVAAVRIPDIRSTGGFRGDRTDVLVHGLVLERTALPQHPVGIAGQVFGRTGGRAIHGRARGQLGHRTAHGQPAVVGHGDVLQVRSAGVCGAVCPGDRGQSEQHPRRPGPPDGPRKTSIPHRWRGG